MGAIAIDTMPQRYGWAKALSTAAAGRLAIREFMILPDFSRCQGQLIGRVSARKKQPHPELMKDFP
jgi:hypothetical protein